jgi:hypothetical protein
MDKVQYKETERKFKVSNSQVNSFPLLRTTSEQAEGRDDFRLHQTYKILSNFQYGILCTRGLLTSYQYLMTKYPEITSIFV